MGTWELGTPTGNDSVVTSLYLVVCLHRMVAAGREAGSSQGRWVAALSYGYFSWGEESQSLRAVGRSTRDYGICSVESFDSWDLPKGETNWDVFVRLESLKRFECEGRFVSEWLVGDVMI